MAKVKIINNGKPIEFESYKISKNEIVIMIKEAVKKNG